MQFVEGEPPEGGFGWLETLVGFFCLCLSLSMYNIVIHLKSNFVMRPISRLGAK